MGLAELVVTAPHATAYDSDYPTRSTENYSHALHDILQDMEDATGTWYVTDNIPTTGELQWIEAWMRNAVKVVFDYAEGAIDTYRSTGTPTLVEPDTTEFVDPGYTYVPEFRQVQMQLMAGCYKVMYLIYYMWKTEEDPLLLKEKLQELLVAWPLLDTTIELSSELGQQFKVYPSWKNADLDL